MELIITLKAEKQLARLPRVEQQKAVKKLESLANEPFIGKRLSGELEGFLSVRFWPYRIIYHIDKVKKVVWIDSIIHRQGAYK